MLESLLHVIPGYSLYHAQETIRSDAPFAIKVRDATMGSAITAFHFIVATEHALKIQAATGSAPGGLARSWLMWQRVLPAVVPVGAPIAGTLAATTVIHSGHQSLAPGSQGSRSDNKSFWSSVAQAMTGGFGTGGWQPY